ncbi:MAG: hypothetical protein OH338_00730 [Candidatus Parvarchaeota archaeon]|nr:hypothetical protein [Candidatus Parvarchaeum tengchongense]MCW1299408.1 hypothetical protein [Candidatus Parvarchaeum tengchongense]MCW1311940.1 hypothetical protein [Candidatus Parvarchaeum tengchongense]
MDDSTGMQTNPTSIQLGPIPNGSNKHKYVGIAAIIVLAVFLVFIFASYEGYVPFLKISAATNPYYSVSNFNQLASVSSKLSNTSGPFNMSYSMLISLNALAGPASFSFNLPINGYISHYSPYTKEAAKIDVLSLIKNIAAIDSNANISTFPSGLYYINLTSISNRTYSSLCIPFEMVSQMTNQTLTAIGASVNDTSINTASLLCLSLKTDNVSKVAGNITSLLGSNLNSVNLSKVNNSISKYLQVKYIKSSSYNGQACSILDINSTADFQSKYNVSVGFSSCFSNNYGVPLDGSLIINLTKDSAVIDKALNASFNLSNLILSVQLNSSFNPAPTSVSSLSVLPKGSYTVNQTMLSQLIAAAELSSSLKPTTVATPKALLSYVDAYIPGMVFASNLSFDYSSSLNYYFYLNNPSKGISETFYSSPSIYNNFSSLYDSFSYFLPNNYNMTIDGQPAFGANSTGITDYSYQFYTLYNGMEVYISASAPLNTSYLTELNSTILKMVKNLPLQDIS